MALYDYFQQSMEATDNRAVGDFLISLDKLYKRPKKDLLFHIISAWYDLREEYAGSYRTSRILVDRLHTCLRLLGLEWPGPLIYAKSPHSMSLTDEQRMPITAPIELQGKGGKLGELRRLSAKLSDNVDGLRRTRLSTKPA